MGANIANEHWDCQSFRVLQNIRLNSRGSAFFATPYNLLTRGSLLDFTTRPSSLSPSDFLANYFRLRRIRILGQGAEVPLSSLLLAICTLRTRFSIFTTNCNSTYFPFSSLPALLLVYLDSGSIANGHWEGESTGFKAPEGDRYSTVHLRLGRYYAGRLAVLGGGDSFLLAFGGLALSLFSA